MDNIEYQIINGDAKGCQRELNHLNTLYKIKIISTNTVYHVNGIYVEVTMVCEMVKR